MSGWMQMLIILLSGAAILLMSARGEWARYAPVVGLAGQPFWAIETIRADQWGMAVLVLVYTFAWGRMLWDAWGAAWWARRGGRHGY